MKEGIKIYNGHQSNNRAKSIGEGSTVHSHVWIGDQVCIGKRCKIQAFAFIPNGVTIGDDVFIGPRATFTNDKKPPSNEVSKITVRRGARIGAGAVLVAPLTVGEGAMVGAGAVVTKSVPSGETWVGNPAKKIRS